MLIYDYLLLMYYRHPLQHPTFSTVMRSNRFAIHCLERFWSNLSDTNNKNSTLLSSLCRLITIKINVICQPFWKYSTVKKVFECQNWHEKHIKCLWACSVTPVEKWITAGCKWGALFPLTGTRHNFSCIMSYEPSPKISVLFPSQHNVWCFPINNYKCSFCFWCLLEKIKADASELFWGKNTTENLSSVTWTFISMFRLRF